MGHSQAPPTMGMGVSGLLGPEPARGLGEGLHIPGGDGWHPRSSLQGSVLLDGQGVDPAIDAGLLASCLGRPGNRQSGTGLRTCPCGA